MKAIELTLEFGPLDDDVCYVLASSPIGDAHGLFRMPFNQAERERLQRELLVPAVQHGHDDGFQAKAVGLKLFQALFTHKVNVLYQRALEGYVLELRLRFQPRLIGADILQGLPWEYLFDPDLGRFLARSPNLSVVRELALPRRLENETPSQAPLNSLFISAEPRLFVEGKPFNPTPAEHYRQLQSVTEKKPTLRFKNACFHATKLRIAEALQREKPDVIYVYLHGTNYLGKGGYLGLEDEQGQEVPISSEDFAALIVDSHPYPEKLQLVYLNVCHSGEPAEIDEEQQEIALLPKHGAINSEPPDSDLLRVTHGLEYAGVAEAFFLKGVTHVIAMGSRVDTKHVSKMAEVFFREINNGRGFAMSLTQARRQLTQKMTGDIEWGKPIHISRRAFGRIHKINWDTIQKTWSLLGLLIFYLCFVFQFQIQGANLGLPGTTLEGPPAALMGMTIVGPLYFLFLWITRIYIKRHNQKKVWYETIPQFFNIEFNYFYRFGRCFQYIVVFLFFVLPIIAQANFLREYLEGTVYYDLNQLRDADGNRNFVTAFNNWPSETEALRMTALGQEEALNRWISEVNSRYQVRTRNVLDHFIPSKVLMPGDTVLSALNQKMDYVYHKRKLDYFPIIQPWLYLVFFLINACWFILLIFKTMILSNKKMI